GTVSVATSVGITARVLSERGKLDTPEGTTILAGAVIDDVLGLVVLAVVAMLGGRAAAGHAPASWVGVGLLAARAIAFWLGGTAAFALLAGRIARLLGLFRSEGTASTIALGIALLLAGLAERVGLAMIIGAYIVGLG